MFDIDLASVYSADFHLELIEYHIKYYIDIGVSPDRFNIILHGLNKNRIDEAYSICCKYFTPRFVWTDQYFTESKTNLLFAMMNNYVERNKLVIYPDVDEFHEYPNGLGEVINLCNKNPNLVVRGRFIDRISRDLQLKEIDINKSLWEQFPIKIKSTKFIKNLPLKIMILREGMFSTRGGHQILGKSKSKGTFECNGNSDIEYLDNFYIHHFRWNNYSFIKYKERFLSTSENHWNDIIEYLSKNNNKVNLEDITIE